MANDRDLPVAAITRQAGPRERTRSRFSVSQGSGGAPVRSSPVLGSGQHQWFQTSPPTCVFSFQKSRNQSGHWPVLSWPHPEGSDPGQPGSCTQAWPLPATHIRDVGMSVCGRWHVNLHPPRLPRGCLQSWRAGTGGWGKNQLRLNLGVEFLKTVVASLACELNDSPNTGW